MFSQLGPLFKTTFRKAESNDTRQKIPHEEHDKGRKKREEEEHKKTEQRWEDDTSVSIVALRTFLIEFLQTLPGGEESIAVIGNPPQGGQDSLSTRPPEPTRPTSTKNAKAARAYQAMAEKSHDTPAPRPDAPDKDSKNRAPTADLLKSQELRDIHQLIHDLDNLAEAGHQNLQIKPAESFLDSLKNAVRLIQGTT